MSKTVLITGASSGIGKASAKLFAAQGWQVVATMRQPADGAELTALPGIVVEQLDVEDRASIGRAVTATLTRFGAIDLLVNNAGYGQYGVFEALSDDKIARQFQVNLFGVMDLTRAVLPAMRARKSGIIVNVSSGAGIFGLPGTSLYHASKFALEGWSESMSYELAAVGITIKLVEPHGGVTETSFGARSAADMAADPALVDYAPFVATTLAAFGRMGGARTMSASDVAAAIYRAATDGTDTLRYPVGDDARGFVKARRPFGDEPYMQVMRSYFPKP